MKTIFAVDNKWGLGKKNDLLFNLKADMRHFVEHTRGKVVVMGSNTLLSFPGRHAAQKPRKHRAQPKRHRRRRYNKGLYPCALS
ncbi:MAG: dihydrofolate reductase [Christensenella sp.]|nr:MAG: dihydrofolate reductase [Christensenella sp.]